jgi:hypothetical protein
VITRIWKEVSRGVSLRIRVIVSSSVSTYLVPADGALSGRLLVDQPLLHGKTAALALSLAAAHAGDVTPAEFAVPVPGVVANSGTIRARRVRRYLMKPTSIYNGREIWCCVDSTTGCLEIVPVPIMKDNSRSPAIAVLHRVATISANFVSRFGGI